jgi:hypothetical protein
MIAGGIRKMFGIGKKKSQNGEPANAKVEELPGPQGIPDMVGSYMVTEMKKDPDWVWKLKGVIRPVGKKTFYCRVFDEDKAKGAGVKVKDWTWLDECPELILWEGYCDKETRALRTENFVEH